MKTHRTNRGFRRANFKDLTGVSCSVQESSLATENAIWLGCDEGVHAEGVCMARMQLTQEQVQELLPLLQHFAKTGELP